MDRMGDAEVAIDVDAIKEKKPYVVHPRLVSPSMEA